MTLNQALYSGPVIDDTNYKQLCPPVRPDGGNWGRIPRDYAQVPEGMCAGASMWDKSLEIPESEWDARIVEMTAKGQLLSQLAEQSNPRLDCLDQNGTNYCWCNAVVMACMFLRLRMNLPLVRLSPASVACIVKNFSNSGGWGGEALDQIVKAGVATQATWPPNAISKQYHTAAEQTEAMNYRVTEWWELPSRSFSALMSCLLTGLPVAIGLNWWSHEILAVDPVLISAGVYGVRILNSYGRSYGTNGYAVLSRSKATPDDAVAPRSGLIAA